MATEARDVMTIEQAAEYLQVTEEALRALLQSGELPAVRLDGDEWRVPRGALAEWLRAAAYANLWPVRRARGERALERLDALRRQMLERRGGVPFPDGHAAQLIREGRP